MAKYRARYYIEVDVDIVCDWEDPVGRDWGLSQLDEASGVFISGEVGDLLDSNLEVQEVKVFRTYPDGTWKELE